MLRGLRAFEMNPKGNIKILFVGSLETSGRTYGAQMDFKLLNKHFEVRTINLRKTKNFPKFAIRALKNILWADVSFSWFVNKEVFFITLLSKLSGRKSMIVASGYTVANVPEINYGSMLEPRKRIMTKLVLKLADKILAVSRYNQMEISRCVRNPNIELVYHGVAPDEFIPGRKSKCDLVITVGIVNSSNVKRKGLETFVKAASYMPSVDFVLIGPHIDSSVEFLKSIAPPNVEFAGFVPHSQLLEYMQKARVYVQVSAHEAFGLSLAEAMLCECVPVVTDRAAIPEVVGDTGFYVRYDDPKATAEAIRRALGSDKAKGARNRIKDMFPIGKREKILVQVIERLSGDKGA